MTVAVTLGPLLPPLTLGPRKGWEGPREQNSHLNPGLRQIDLQGHLLAGIHIRVLGLGKQGLQLLQLAPGEGGPLPPLLSWRTLWGAGQWGSQVTGLPVSSSAGVRP